MKSKTIKSNIEIVLAYPQVYLPCLIECLSHKKKIRHLPSESYRNVHFTTKVSSIFHTKCSYSNGIDVLRIVLLFLFHLGVNIDAGNGTYGLDCCFDKFLLIKSNPQMLE